MDWQPNQESLKTLALCLRDSLSGFNKTSQKLAETMLNQAKENPDINNYLAYIFSTTTPPQELSVEDWHLIRCSAGIMLKNNIKANYKSPTNPIPESSIEMVKAAIPIGISDKNSQIRSFAGNILTEMVRKGGLAGWPGLLDELAKLFTNHSGQVPPEAQEGAMNAMAKICEDNEKLLEREHLGIRPLVALLPRLIEASKSPLPKVRAQALTALNVFTGKRSQPMLNNIDALLHQLFNLASDPGADIRRQVCRAFVRLVETRPDKLLPHLPDLVNYILTQQKSEDEDLACEAAEFWLSMGEQQDLCPSLEPYVPKIIPVLLEGMVYSGDDILALGGASDDEDEEDREEDIKPMFAKKSLARGAKGEGAGSADANQNGNDEKLASMDEDLEEGEVDDDEDDEGDENPDQKWTLRKCSAAALDVFASAFGGRVFTSILPYLQTNLRQADWPQREAAVLALGAVAEGCMDVVIPHLPELVPYLVSLLNDEEPVVRTITCWTLARYAPWAAHLPKPEDKQAYFVPMMEGLLHKMLDKNKKVQEAGASAMANLEEKAGKNIEPYCGPIIDQFVLCFQKYKDKNRWVLYDCVQTLAEHVGPILARPELCNKLMPTLIHRWQTISDESREMFPLLECLSYVAMAMGDAFTPYAEPIFGRCVNIIHQNLELSHAARSNATLDQPDKDFLVTSLDLIGAIIQALEDSKAVALVNSAPQFFELLGFCLEDPTDEVQQSAFAVLGDCAKYVFDRLKPHLNETILPILLRRLDLEHILDEEIDGSFSVVNNACWSAGEIALQHKKDMETFIPELLQRLVEIMSNPQIPAGVTENAATALGRLGLYNAEMLAPHLEKFAKEFLEIMDEVDPSEEKATAFLGFSNVVILNPRCLEDVVMHLFSSIAGYRDLRMRNPIKQELHDGFQNVFSTFRMIIAPDQFHELLNSLTPEEQQALTQTYVL
ncbi:importin subunit beta-2 [Podospora fimiseda]|uniref:Importin subunit beta-2 n=1 Tax=Podospora fimiseda TaxID=252190 RepID=A0AAN7H1P8_9PEZI|nr:importin subunit beta-2 [Podospora fimiseda]